MNKSVFRRFLVSAGIPDVYPEYSGHLYAISCIRDDPCYSLGECTEFLVSIVDIVRRRQTDEQVLARSLVKFLGLCGYPEMSLEVIKRLPLDDDLSFRIIDNPGGFSDLQSTFFMFLKSNNLRLARDIIRRAGHNITRIWALNMITRGFRVESLTFVDKCADAHGFKIDWASEEFVVALKTSKNTTNGLVFLLRVGAWSKIQELEIVEYMLKHFSANTAKFFVDVGIVSPELIMNTPFTSDSGKCMDVKLYVARSFPAPATLKYTRSLVGISDSSVAGIKTLVNYIHDSHNTQCYFLLKVAYFNRANENGKTAENMLMASFRVYLKARDAFASIAEGYDNPSLYRDPELSKIFETYGPRHVLVDEFRRNKYGSKDPGFLLMVWNMTKNGSRLPSELLRLVFETAFLGPEPRALPTENVKSAESLGT